MGSKHRRSGVGRAQLPTHSPNEQPAAVAAPPRRARGTPCHRPCAPAERRGARPASREFLGQAVAARGSRISQAVTTDEANATIHVSASAKTDPSNRAKAPSRADPVSLADPKLLSCRYDAVVGPDGSHEQVYAHVRDAVQHVIEGQNATVFAYGQTGTGKTFTMLGSGVEQEFAEGRFHQVAHRRWGVLPRAMQHLFHAIEAEEPSPESARGTLSARDDVTETKQPERDTASPGRAHDRGESEHSDHCMVSPRPLTDGMPSVEREHSPEAAVKTRDEAAVETRDNAPLQEGEGSSTQQDAPTDDGGEQATQRDALTDEGAAATTDELVVSDTVVMCSYMQVYNGRVFDLLADPKRQKPLVLREGTQGAASTSLGATKSSDEGSSGVYVSGLSEYRVTGLEDVLELMNAGTQNRARRATEYNEASSRSHAILRVSVAIELRPRAQARKVARAKAAEAAAAQRAAEASDAEEAAEAAMAAATAANDLEAARNAGGSHRSVVRRAMLTLVDLAGSEKWNTGPDAAEMTSGRQKELTSINSSLSALGNCIAALVRKRERSEAIANARRAGGVVPTIPQVHIPYRDSPLTRLLQNSLGGNCRTVVVATVSPVLGAVEETVSTLHFADRARRVLVRVRANEMFDDHERLAQAKREVSRFKKALRAFIAVYGGTLDGPFGATGVPPAGWKPPQVVVIGNGTAVAPVLTSDPAAAASGRFRGSAIPVLDPSTPSRIKKHRSSADLSPAAITRSKSQRVTRKLSRRRSKKQNVPDVVQESDSEAHVDADTSPIRPKLARESPQAGSITQSRVPVRASDDFQKQMKALSSSQPSLDIPVDQGALPWRQHSRDGATRSAASLPPLDPSSSTRSRRLSRPDTPPDSAPMSSGASSENAVMFPTAASSPPATPSEEPKFDAPAPVTSADAFLSEFDAAEARFRAFMDRLRDLEQGKTPTPLQEASPPKPAGVAPESVQREEAPLVSTPPRAKAQPVSALSPGTSDLVEWLNTGQQQQPLPAEEPRKRTYSPLQSPHSSPTQPAILQQSMSPPVAESRTRLPEPAPAYSVPAPMSQSTVSFAEQLRRERAEAEQRASKLAALRNKYAAMGTSPSASSTTQYGFRSTMGGFSGKYGSSATHLPTPDPAPVRDPQEWWRRDSRPNDVPEDRHAPSTDAPRRWGDYSEKPASRWMPETPARSQWGTTGTASSTWGSPTKPYFPPAAGRASSPLAAPPRHESTAWDRSKPAPPLTAASDSVVPTHRPRDEWGNTAAAGSSTSRSGTGALPRIQPYGPRDSPTLPPLGADHESGASKALAAATAAALDAELARRKGPSKIQYIEEPAVAPAAPARVGAAAFGAPSSRYARGKVPNVRRPHP
jgi:hypothetical protein